MKILRFNDLKTDKGITWSRVHVWREERAGRFPRHIRLGRNSIGWVEREIDEWLAERVAARDEDKGSSVRAA